ncbi:chromodomain-helicase-DNA-binding protein 8-like [Geospiza fortis]|uniref:Chromodomain-helicase-DNA-binding protein 8-like n=1 Tax=Geospiza fortis TaxID=48883 RepID=A0A8N5F188_GEOFO|nr:chromodomain-helicase-DNA-binding protein 8-like [Geospiza fortis]
MPLIFLPIILLIFSMTFIPIIFITSSVSMIFFSIILLTLISFISMTFDEEPFNPDYVEVDRILDESHSVDKDNGEPVVYYLVKWCSLPYEDSTWELQEDVDEAKVAEFKRIQARHPELKRQPRPQAGAWKKLEASHEYKNHNQLREYQLEGVNWLLFNSDNRQNCILADEMGLGKSNPCPSGVPYLCQVYPRRCTMITWQVIQRHRTRSDGNQGVP